MIRGFNPLICFIRVYGGRIMTGSTMIKGLIHWYALLGYRMEEYWKTVHRLGTGICRYALLGYRVGEYWQTVQRLGAEICRYALLGYRMEEYWQTVHILGAEICRYALLG